jgi:hypothetical protein
MKRIHLFEFEDLAWFPNWIRKCMTRLIIVVHELLGTEKQLAALLDRLLKETKSDRIIDLCSGSGGPMPGVLYTLQEQNGFADLHLRLTDLYPNLDAAKRINGNRSGNLVYQTEPQDATQLGAETEGLRTMICSFHHMPPTVAQNILQAAADSRQPILIYEISDNSLPTFLWWLALPTSFLMCFLITLKVRPITWQQLVFTYLIPIIPIFYAWDGAVSNARTYTLEDLDELLAGIRAEGYKWEKGSLKGKMGNKLYLLGKSS